MHTKGSDLYALARQSLSNSDRWFGDTPVAKSVPDMTLGLVGEVGSLATLIQKLNRGTVQMEDSSTRFQLGMELADVLIYVLNLCALLNIDPRQVYEMKTAENEKRFTQERAIRETKEQEIVDGVRVKSRAS